MINSMPSTMIKEEDHFEGVGAVQSTERTPLLITAPNKESINNPLQERLKIRRLKVIYSSITLADIFQKAVHTTFTTSFLLLAFAYLDLSAEKSLAACYILGACSGLIACIINLNIEYFFSRQKAIVVGFMIYFVGFAVLCGFTAEPPAGRNHLIYFTIIPLFLIFFGDGICKSCISDFTYSQLVEKHSSPDLGFYLMKLFWIGHIGAFFLILFLLGITEYTKFELAFGLACVCILAGLISFMTAWNKYEAFGKDKSSLIKLIWSIVFDARKNRKLHTTQQKSEILNREAPRGLDFAEHWIDYAKQSFGGSHTDVTVEQTKSFLKISVMFFSFVPYWVANSQCYSMFIYQAFHLNRVVGDVTMPVTWIALFHVAAVLLFVQLLDKIITPFFRRRGHNFLPSWKISIGFVFGMLAMLCATSLEHVAHSHYKKLGNATFHVVGQKNVTYVSSVHILWAIPQFTFLGISEVLVGLTGLGLACRLCKGLLQKGITSVYYFTIALGHVLSLIVIELDWLPLNHYLDSTQIITFFASMAAACFVSLIFFLLVLLVFDFGARPRGMSVSYPSTSFNRETTRF